MVKTSVKFLRITNNEGYEDQTATLTIQDTCLTSISPVAWSEPIRKQIRSCFSMVTEASSVLLHRLRQTHHSVSFYHPDRCFFAGLAGGAELP